MNITNINRIYTQNIKNKTIFTSKPLFSQPDIFVKSTSFKGQTKEKDDKTFNEFVKWANSNDFLKIKSNKDVKLGGILGSGFEGTTYEIPNTDKWVLKQYKRGEFIQKTIPDTICTPINDISPKLNIGQTIGRIEIPSGRYASVYYILKRQTGKSLGVSQGNAHKVDDTNVNTHLKTLNLLATAPQSTFDKCISDINEIMNIGYEIDCENPNNFMFDKEKSQINFVDINDKSQKDKNMYGEVLFALTGGEFASAFNETEYDENIKKEAENLTKEIINKYFTAMKNNNKKFEKGKYFNEFLKFAPICEILKPNNTNDKLGLLKANGLM